MNKNVKDDVSIDLYDVCNDIDCDLETIALCEDFKAELEESSNIVKRDLLRVTTRRPRKRPKRPRRKKMKKVKINLKVDAKTDQFDKRAQLLKIKSHIASIQSVAGANVTRISFKESKIKCAIGHVRKKLRCGKFTDFLLFLLILLHLHYALTAVVWLFFGQKNFFLSFYNPLC